MFLYKFDSVCNSQTKEKPTELYEIDSIFEMIRKWTMGKFLKPGRLRLPIPLWKETDCVPLTVGIEIANENRQSKQK